MLSTEGLLRVSRHLHSAQYLQGIHLSDNGIAEEDSLMGQLFHIFGLSMQDLPRRRTSAAEATVDHKHARIQSFKEAHARSSRIHDMIRDKFCLDPPKDLEKREVEDINEYYDREVCL